MDMGVIPTIKCLCHVKVAPKLLALIETKLNPTPKDIDLYDALIMLKQSRDEISAETVKDCFVKSSFQLNSVESIKVPEIEDISVWDELTAGMDVRGASNIHMTFLACTKQYETYEFNKSHIFYKFP
jgi:hypothetical protein